MPELSLRSLVHYHSGALYITVQEPCTLSSRNLPGNIVHESCTLPFRSLPHLKYRSGVLYSIVQGPGITELSLYTIVQGVHYRTLLVHYRSGALHVIV